MICGSSRAGTGKRETWLSGVPDVTAERRWRDDDGKMHQLAPPAPPLAWPSLLAPSSLPAVLRKLRLLRAALLRRSPLLPRRPRRNLQLRHRRLSRLVGQEGEAKSPQQCGLFVLGRQSRAGLGWPANRSCEAAQVGGGKINPTVL